MAVKMLTKEDEARLAEVIAAETVPLPVLGGGKTCRVDGCGQPATARPCEFCHMAICEEHTGSRVINSERYVACPHHARRDR